MRTFKGLMVDDGKPTYSQLFTAVVDEGELTMVV